MNTLKIVSLIALAASGVFAAENNRREVQLGPIERFEMAYVTTYSEKNHISNYCICPNHSLVPRYRSFERNNGLWIPLSNGKEKEWFRRLFVGHKRQVAKKIWAAKQQAQISASRHLNHCPRKTDC